MNNAIRVLLAFFALFLSSISCQKEKEEFREKTFVTAEKPRRLSGLVSPALARTSQGTLLMTLFLHSGFPSATEAHDAIAVFQSKNEGATWWQISSIPSFVTYGVWGHDLAIDERDNLYLTWVAGVYDVNTPKTFKAIFFSRSDDSGKSWTDPVYVNDSLTGQRWMPRVAVSGGNVYIAWLEHARGKTVTGATFGPQDVYFATSADKGATWSRNQCLEKDLDRKDSASGAPSLCVGSDGTVYCAYFSIRRYEKKVGGFWLAKSNDGGKTFSIKLKDVGPLGEVCLQEKDGKLYLAVVYIRGIKSFAMRSPKTSQEIRLYISSDGGKKWTKPVIIDDDQAHQHKTNVQLLSVGPEKLIAAWDDDRGGVYMAASINGGKEWGKNMKISEPSHAGATPLDIAVDASRGTFYLILSDIVEGAGDATYLVKGEIAP